MKNLLSLGLVIAIIVLIILVVIYGPIFTIWALNCLFRCAIPLNFWTWLSALWLGGLAYGAQAKAKK